MMPEKMDSELRATSPGPGEGRFLVFLPTFPRDEWLHHLSWPWTKPGELGGFTCGPSAVPGGEGWPSGAQASAQREGGQEALGGA